MLNRRQALGTIGKAALVASAGGAALTTTEASVAVRDPMLERLERYRADVAWINKAGCALPDEECEWHTDAMWRRFYGGEERTFPAITTEAGAIETLRQVLEEDAFCDSFAEGLLRTALAYFEGRA